MSSDDRHLREELLSRRSVYDGRLLHAFEDSVRLPEGNEARRELVEHPGAVTIVARADDGRAVLVRQWRHAMRRAFWELPAGTREPGEDPDATARRELTEETGYHAKEWRELGHGPVSPGYSSEVIWFFSATGLTGGDSTPDVDELLDVGLFDHAQLSRMAAEGEVDLKTIAGLALAGIPLDV
ncbi:MAG: NUDIX hydrolase [Candidatus Dormibacteraeota bacterium]|uniref:NUDIX hydrolase n=1 Tax=Candidatus Amunia macphersoniae TaxID=3127014 RepID=A0A934NIY7_9BACT|nr:NUDIX hydrolase [Candidatus Dormibacteraeota bacterium]